MKVLLDESIPRDLRDHLPDHDVTTVRDTGWQGKSNGELLELASPHFDVHRSRFDDGPFSSSASIFVERTLPASRCRTVTDHWNAMCRKRP